MKFKRSFSILILFILLLTSFGYADKNEASKVYIVPINGEINRATYNYIKDIMNDLNKEKVDAIIFEIDTYGGLILEAEKIKNLIIGTNIPTISYVNSKAESAGVLLAIASEKVVVAKNATIGSAETIPNTEKILSLWRAMLRDTAQYRGRDSNLIEAMADSDIVIDEVSHKGKLVNLTSKEALQYGVADYTSESYEDILAHFGIETNEIVEKKEGLQIKLAKYISSPYMSSLLLALGFTGLIIEMLTPGFGFGATVSVLGFGLYFSGNILAGNSNWTSLALFVTGLILLVIEGIVPGFGLPGISGIILVFAGTILAMSNFSIAILSLSLAIIITTIVTIILMKLGFRSKLLDKIVLNSKHDKEKGYLSVDSMDILLGKEGTAITELRPSGFIDIDGKKYDALSDGSFIPRDSFIKVVRVEGSKIFVRRV